MNTLLVINSSGRHARSVTRSLTARFAAGWRSKRPQGEILLREAGTEPVPPVDEAWIAAAFTPAESRTPAMHRALALSETLIGEVLRAEAVVIGAPDPQWGERVVAIVAPAHADEPPVLARVQQHCRAHLAGYKLPRALHVVDAVVLLAAGAGQAGPRADGDPVGHVGHA